MRLIIATVLVMAPCLASASPIYLKCQLDHDIGKQAAWDVTLNEDAGRVTYAFPEIGRAFTVRGVFTADSVTFNGFTVDRETMAFQRDLSDTLPAGFVPLIEKGKCTIAEVKRAF